VQNGKNAPHWVSELAEAHNVEALSSTETFMRELQDDFFSHRIFIFTPKGDVVDLPMDSTTIDFAYAIHSEIGHHTSRAKVNGKLVALDTTLKNGDIVEIETSKTAHPSSKWIEYVRTSMARRHINQWLTHQNKEKEADSH
jgi:GTP pyrophosphokinase